MSIKLGVVMDPIATIHYEKDSTLAMLEEAQKRGWQLYYFEQADLFLQNGMPYGEARGLTVFSDPKKWFALDARTCLPLAELDIILMRKDPPFNEEFIYTTYILEHAERLGVLVANKPAALRDANEKLFTTYFPHCIPPTLVTQSQQKLQAFWREHQDIVCKPLNSMGGQSIFRLKQDEMNANVIFDMLTHNGTSYIMAQKYIPEIKQGDKRILMVDGEPIPYMLARVPQQNDWRGNLAAGAKGLVQPLGKRDHAICAEVGSLLRDRGLYFVGLDIIGDYLTEINVTSPTCIREINAGANLNCSAIFLDKLVTKIR